MARLSTLYQDLLSGGSHCVDRNVLSDYLRMGQNTPAGSQKKLGSSARASPYFRDARGAEKTWTCLPSTDWLDQRLIRYLQPPKPKIETIQIT